MENVEYMDKSISEQIKDYARANPLATAKEMCEIFKVTRQLVFKNLHEIYTDEELEARKFARMNQHSDEIGQMLKDGHSFSDICAKMELNKNKLTRIINSNPVLQAIVEENELKDIKRIEAISIDWRDDMPLATMMEKHRIGTTITSAASHISKLRSRYGETMFPLRIDNHFDLNAKYEKFKALIAEGAKPEEIYQTLGYKTASSMRSSFAAIIKKKETNENAL